MLIITLVEMRELVGKHNLIFVMTFVEQRFERFDHYGVQYKTTPYKNIWILGDSLVGLPKRFSDLSDKVTQRLIDAYGYYNLTVNILGPR